MKKATRNANDRNMYLRLTIIILAIVAIILSAALSGRAILNVQSEYCYRTLTDTSATLAKDLHHHLYGHRVYLQTIARIIGEYENVTDENVKNILNDYQSDAIVNRLDILLPDKTIITANDGRVDSVDELNFNALAGKAYGVSGKIPCYLKNDKDDLHEHDIAVIHTPIYHDGKPVAILLGVIELEKLAALIDTNSFGGSANIYIIDGSTGDILVNTAGIGPDNLWEWKDNPLDADYSPQKLKQELKAGVSGQVKFTSNNSDETQYFCYEPIENTSWRVGIAVKESAVFASTLLLRRYIAAFFIIVIVALFIILMVILHHNNEANRRAKLLSEIDLLTECNNRNKYELDMARLANHPGNYLGCLFVDVNGLRERNNLNGHAQGDLMLRIVSEQIRKVFGDRHTYRIGGDEFIVLLHTPPDDITAQVQTLTNAVEKQGYSVAVGFAEQNTTSNAAALTRLAEKKMYADKSRYYQNAPH